MKRSSKHFDEIIQTTSFPEEVWKSILARTIVVKPSVNHFFPPNYDTSSLRAVSCVSQSLSLIVHALVRKYFKFLNPACTNWILSHFADTKTLDVSLYRDCVSDSGLKNLTNLASLVVNMNDFPGTFQGLSLLT